MEKLTLFKKLIISLFKALRWEYVTWKNKRKVVKDVFVKVERHFDLEPELIVTDQERVEAARRLIVSASSKIKVNQLEGGINFIEYAPEEDKESKPDDSEWEDLDVF